MSEQDSPSQREWLRGICHQLLDPANAIVGFCRIAIESSDVSEEQLEALTSMQDAGRGLIALLDDARNREDGSDLNVTELRRLRHDFLNELNIVEGYVELLMEEPATEVMSLEEDLVKIHRAAERSRDVIDEIQDWIASRGAHQEGAVPEPAEVQGQQQGQSPPAHSVPSAQRHDAYHQTRSTLVGLHGSTATGTLDPDRRARLLVVDDDESNRDLLERRLQRLGYDVELAVDGMDALERLRGEQAFDLVLLDVVMPRMNGYEVLSEMKADELLRHVPVIFVTAFDDIDSLVRCIEMGADDYLPKTFNPVLLNARISACLQKKWYRDREQHYLRQLQRERERAESLLLNILPQVIAERLKAGEDSVAIHYDDATVLFADLVNFTAFSAKVGPGVVVDRLNEVFHVFDDVVARLGLEKIKTIGDAYMLASGVPVLREGHASLVAQAALDMMHEVHKLRADGDFPCELRIGIHSGPLVAGVIGRTKFSFDLWGDTVNIAARMESMSVPGRIQISAETRAQLGEEFNVEPRGPLEIKGKGALQTFFLTGRATT